MNPISQWLKDYALKHNKNFVVGVSGGVDSALASTLCAETGIDTYVVSMPIETNPQSLRLAHQHIVWLKSLYSNVKPKTVYGDKAINAFREMLPPHSLAEANTKSRIRMIILYWLATIHNGIVVGTGNKVEDFGVGFFTKHGDGGVDISPIADLYKSEVRQMARGFGVLDEIVNATPTDGLWLDTRSDESQIGVSYDELEEVMKGGGTPQAKAIYQAFHDKNKHKMEPVPIWQKSDSSDLAS